MILARIGRSVSFALGATLFLALWQAVGHYHLAGSAWPPLSEVVAYLVDPLRRGLFGRAIGATLSSAALGYLIGAAIGTLLAITGQLVPRLRKGADRMNAWLHAIPMIALGPIFVLLLGIDAAPVAMAALGVMFVFYISVTSGFGLASRPHADLMTVLGASRRARLVMLTLPAAMPAIATGIKLAVPRAGIGAVLGEWFGASRGLGVLMLTAMQEAQIPLLWSAVLLVTLLSLVFFGLGAMLERITAERFQ
jgi:ABC-type nitrate/sulfonate/bicarbonate transport system permease component